jgi:protocatechuate 3,4-dioxygenase beta subunit
MLHANTSDESNVRPRGRSLLAAFVAALIGVGAVLVPAAPAAAATFTLTATRANSGTTTADAAGTCPTQGSTATAHCAGYDVSLAATDQILRSGDTAQVRFDFAFDGVDTGVVLQSTLPQANGGSAAVWTAIPAACAAGSSRTDSNRTLNCLIANPPGAGDGSVTATFRLEPLAFDGYTFTVPATIDSASSNAVAANSTATYTSSSAPLWNLIKNYIANVLPVPFFYRGPAGEPGFAIPSSTLVSASKVGGFSPLVGPITWTETMSSAAIDTSAYRLLNWGNYGADGCGSDGVAAAPAVSGYTSTAVRVSNQYGAVSGGLYDCTQLGGPGSPVSVTWQNPAASPAAFAANVWMMMWVPIAAVPLGTTTAPMITAGGFDPVDFNGVSNYFAGTEPPADSARAHGSIVNADNRAAGKAAISDVANPYSSASPGADGSTLRGEAFASLVSFQNTGTVSQTPVQLCDVFDVTTQQLTPFTANASVPAGTYVVAVTRGPIGDPITAPPYEPAATYNNTSNFAVDSSVYIVEYAAGELGASTPTEAPAANADLQATSCGDAATATGWHTDPNDPAFATYAGTLGLSSPFDVINRVRVTFVGDAIEPGVFVGIKVHTTTRSAYRAASTQAGQIIYATTLISDIAAFAYPQSTVPQWTKTGVAGPRVAGRINVDTGVDFISATPATVQAGAPGQNRTTYTLRGYVAFGENVATTQPLRIVYHLPVGMRYVNGSASIAPDHVLPQASGATVLVWDFGDITGPTNGVTFTNNFSFTAEADPLAPTPSVNWSTVVAESVSPTGQQIDLDPPTNGCATFLNITVPPTSNVPVETVAQVLPPADYAGCFGQNHNRRSDYVGITIGNAFLSLAALKTAFQPLVESGADDGVAGAEVGWDLTYKNTTSNVFPGVDIVDVLPYPGDGRSPESDFAGTVDLSSISTTDSLSVTPNGLPVSATVVPSRSGTTFYVTNRPSAQVERDPYAATNLQGGATTWCVLADLGDPGCPADLSEVTGLRVISGSLATQEEETVRLGFATDGAEAGDLMTNTAMARVISVITPVEISGDAIQFAASSLSGTVWEDASADGVIDAGEGTRLGGVSVRIVGNASTSGEAVDRTVVTAADGTYTFAGLPAGSYTVTVDQASARAVDPAYGLTSDPDGIAAPDGSFAVNLPIGTDLVERDFGFATSSLAGTVFGDADNDGAVDAGESGIDAVTVTLTGTDDLGQAVSRTTTTDGSGAYVFADLRPGTYQLEVTPPTGMFGGRNVPGTAGGTGGAVGANTISGVPLDAGENGVAYLFGILEPEIVEGVVYADDNDNGVRDAGEPGIGGVTVTLSGDADLTTQTLPDGRFIFSSLAPGDYEIAETQPLGYLDGTNETNGSVGTVNGDTITGIVVGDSQDTDGYSFGEVPVAGIQGVVYHDVNANGAQDAGEPGIPGAEVSLSGDASAGPVTTDADGAYRFDDLAPGSYTVTATEAAGYIDGLETTGTAGGAVSTANGANTIGPIDLEAGEHATGYLFGDVQVASVSGVVFVDDDGDGAQGPGEPGIADVDLHLTGTDLFGAAVDLPATTTVGGMFAFDDLVPGTYTLTETQPVDYFDGIDTAGTAGGTVGADEFTDIVLASGVAGTGYTFGERASVSIGGVVFADIDGDGVQDAGESGILGVTVSIESSDSAITDSVVTAADGSWSFAGLPPGTYTITEEGQPLVGYIDGASVAGTAGGTVAPNQISGIVLNAPAAGYRFAEIPLSIIRGTVWHDADDDGVIDAGETPIAGVEITLGGDASRTTQTGADGAFVFGGLVPGSYALLEEDLDNWSDGATLLGGAGGTAAVNSVTGIDLGAGEDGSGYGFGERAAELQLSVLAQTQDAQLETGPYVRVGDPVRLGYVLTNNGDTALDGIVVTDDVLGEVVCDSTGLAAHSSMTCTLETTAVAGQQVHSGSASASVVPRDAGGPSTLAVTELQASDVAHYFGMIASAQITAEVEGDEATTAPGPAFVSGSALGIVVTITNTGNVPLMLDSLDTGELGALDCGTAAELLPGASIQCTVDLTPPAGNYVYPLTVTLTAPDGTDVAGEPVPTEATAAATVFFQVLEPGVPIPAMPVTGITINWQPISIGLMLLVLGGMGLLLWSRARRES